MKGAENNTVLKNGDENYYTTAGLDDRASGPKALKAAKKLYDQGKLGLQNSKRTAAFEYLMKPSEGNISPSTGQRISNRAFLDEKLSGERTKANELDMSKANALSGTTTSMHVKEGSKIAKLHAALGHVPASPVVDNQQQQGSNVRPPSPRGVADGPPSPTNKTVKRVNPIAGGRKPADEVESPPIASTNKPKLKPEQTATNKPKLKPEQTATANRAINNRRYINKGNAEPTSTKPVAEVKLTGKEEADLEAKLRKTRGIKSWAMNKMNPNRLNTSGLSDKEQAMKEDLMKQALMKGSTVQITNISQKEVQDLSKTMVANNKKGQGYTR